MTFEKSFEKSASNATCRNRDLHSNCSKNSRACYPTVKTTVKTDQGVLNHAARRVSRPFAAGLRATPACVWWNGDRRNYSSRNLSVYDVAAYFITAAVDDLTHLLHDWGKAFLWHAFKLSIWVSVWFFSLCVFCWLKFLILV